MYVTLIVESFKSWKLVNHKKAFASLLNEVVYVGGKDFLVLNTIMVKNTHLIWITISK